MSKAEFSIQFVSKITGINPHTIRAWEKRYQAVVPNRTENGRRLYSQEQVDRLSMLYDLVNMGNSISDIANQENEQLKNMHEKFVDKNEVKSSSETDFQSIDFKRILQNLMLALNGFKLDIINHELEKLTSNLNHRSFALDLIVPLMQEVGSQMASKKISVAQEHSLSGIVKFHMGKILYGKNLSRKSKKPLLIFATPEGELHEFGIMIAALLSAHYDMNYLYVGTNMPLDALVDTVKQIGADMVILGISPFMNSENKDFAKDYTLSLKDEVGPKTEVWVGGNVEGIFKGSSAIRTFPTLQSLDLELQSISKKGWGH